MLFAVVTECPCGEQDNHRPQTLATGHDVQPDRIVTVFAGQDTEATERARDYMEGFRPSSPSMALFRDGKHVFMLERHQIEGRDASDIATDLKGAYDRFCRSD